MVVVGNGIVCKASVDRYKARAGYAALGKREQADRYCRRMSLVSA
jgi:hypothetical protein